MKFDAVLIIVVILVFALAGWFLARHPEVAMWDDAQHSRDGQ